jgi:hypothetical protein
MTMKNETFKIIEMDKLYGIANDLLEEVAQIDSECE